MKVEIEYNSKTFGECPSDYDFSNVKDINELNFLKWMNVLQSTVTRLKYNIEMFDYYFRLYLLNNIISETFQTFFVLIMLNMSAMISIDFSSLIHADNKLNIDKLKNFCNKNGYIFKNENIQDALRKTKPYTKKAKMLYEEYYDISRKQIYAHIDDILLKDDEVSEIMNKVSSETTQKLLKYIFKILNIIWSAYNSHKLCFTLKKGNDYKKLTKVICEKYGNTNFI